jgi:IS30 family transposase
MSNQEDKPVLTIISDLKNGAVSPDALDKTTRQNCVEVLIGEGYSSAQIAKIMKKTDRTIRRDLEDIRGRNALSPDLEYAKRFIGEVVVSARNHHKHLMRLARTPDATVTEKIQGEAAAWKVLKELVEKMQTLGYLPLKPQEVIGHFLHQAEPDTIEEINAMKKQLAELEEQAKEMDIFDDEISKSIALLNEEVKQSEIKGRILEVKKQLNAEGEEDE